MIAGDIGELQRPDLPWGDSFSGLAEGKGGARARQTIPVRATKGGDFLRRSGLEGSEGDNQVPVCAYGRNRFG